MMNHRRSPLAWILILLLSLQLTFAAEVIIGANGDEIIDNENDHKDNEDCQDTVDSCVAWAASGECSKNPAYMHLNCPRSCNICSCVDLDIERCPQWAYRNTYCVGDQEEFMYTNCRKSCKACGYDGAALETLKKERRQLAAVGGDARLLETPYGYQQIASQGLEGAIATIIQETTDYMEQQVYIDDLYQNVRTSCMVRHDSCAYWKTQGTCDDASKRQYMRQHCAPICQICEELDFQFWCPIDESKPMAVPQPGDLNQLFERIVSEKELFVQYSPKVISRPKQQQQQSDELSAHKDETIQDGPWFIEFESFLTEEECRHLIDLGAQIGYDRSVDTGVQKTDGSFDQVKSTWRTSATAWCSGSCLEDAIFQKVAKRVEEVTGIPQQNAEHLQLLKYEADEFYKYHHDCTPHHVERQMGPRVLTMFLYLNTVEAGGETSFPDINITVTPKIGKAVLWPNVLNEDPLKMDRRTAHQALPVGKGLKYGANLWIHQRDWREVAARRCI